MYRFINGKLVIKGRGNVKPIKEEINKPLPVPLVPKPKPKTDKEIIEEIKKVRLDKPADTNAQVLEKRLKKFVEFKI